VIHIIVRRAENCTDDAADGERYPDNHQN